MATGRKEKMDNFRRIIGTKCYRAAKPDCDTCCQILQDHNIRTVLDFRSPDDSTPDNMDTIYHPFLLKKYFIGGGDKPELVPLSNEQNVKTEELLERDRRYRLIVPLISTMSLARMAPWYIKLLLLICNLIDKFFHTNYAILIVVKYVVNPRGAGGLLFVMEHVVMRQAAEVASILHLLSLPEYVPAVLICNLGKDRTGVISALVSHICGQSRQEIVADYAKSEKELPHDRKDIIAMDKFGLNPAFKQSPPQCLEKLLDLITEKFGSIDQYLDHIGFSKEDQEGLRRNIMSRD